MPAPAATILRARRRAARRNGATAWRGSSRRARRPPSRRCWRPISRRSGRCDADGRPASYPGSPALAQALLRPQDRIALCEAHPEERERLVAALGRDGRLSIVGTDGYVALNAYIPPKERRGVVLIDPPYEAPDESERVEAALARALAKWPRGTYALWRPIKAPLEDARFLNAIAALGAPNILRLELDVGAVAPSAHSPSPLSRSGLLVVNPPFGLIDEARVAHALAGATAAARRGRRVRLRLADGAEMNCRCLAAADRFICEQTERKRTMTLPNALRGKLRLPVIGAPLFIISHPALVIAQCKAGIVGSFPALNARPLSQLDEWLHEITEALAAHDRAHPDSPAAPFAVNQIVHKSNARLEQDMELAVKWKAPIVITSLGAREDVNVAVHSYGGVDAARHHQRPLRP